MKIVLTIILGLLALSLTAQTSSPVKISAGEAKDYIGKSVIVTGRVAEVHVAEKLIRINLDRPFPNQPFTAVVFSSRTNQFPDLTGLKNKDIEVKGTVAEFKGRPEIVLSKTNQIAVNNAEKK